MGATAACSYVNETAGWGRTKGMQTRELRRAGWNSVPREVRGKGDQAQVDKWRALSIGEEAEDVGTDTGRWQD